MKDISRLLLILLFAVLGFMPNIYSQNLDSLVFCSGELIDSVSVDSSADNGFAPNNFLWQPGQTIRVRFMGGSSFVQEKVRRYAREWEQYANLSFQFVTSGTTEIRIAFDREGHYSYIGTGSRNISQNRKTMNLQFDNNTAETEFRRVTLHEFGHALGLRHEHQHPESNIQWNESAVYQYYARCHGWSNTQTFGNILQSFSSTGHYHCSYDPASIMHYPVQNSLTLNNFSVGFNIVLSEEDKSFMRLLYPSDGNRNNSDCGFCVEDCDENNLSITIRGQGNVTISPAGSTATVCNTNCTQQFSNNQIVNITAAPQSGFRFVRWEGSLCNNSSSTSCQLVMNVDHNMTAIFEAVEVNNHNLTVSVVGMGSVRVNTTNSNQTCNTDCTVTLPNQTSITLSANPATGYRFLRWEGDRCNSSINSNCAFSLNRDLEVRAIFEQEITTTNNSLSISVSGSGSVNTTANNNTQNCTTNCTYSFVQNSSVQLQAIPANGHRFVRWEGNQCNASTNRSCNFVLNSNLAMNAIFEPVTLSITPEITLRLVGGGSIAVRKSGQLAGNCTSPSTSCSYDFPGETSVSLQLTATPIAGYRFVRWEGDFCANQQQSTCTFNLRETKNVSAVFEENVSQNCFDFELTPRRVSCNTGLVFVDISNGNPPFNISLDGPVSGQASVNTRSFAITDLTAGQYSIRVQDNNNCSITQLFNIVNACGNLTETEENSVVASRSKKELTIEYPALVKAKFTTKSLVRVAPNYPNPFVKGTRLPLQLTLPSQFNLEIIHLSGKQVYQRQYQLAAGKHLLELNSQIFQASGIYFYRLSFDNQMITGKMVKL